MDDSFIPQQSDIEMLPRWACAAFAARCVSRVQVLYLESWPDAPSENLQRFNHAVERTLNGSKNRLNAIDYTDSDAAQRSPVLGSVVGALSNADAVLDRASHAVHGVNVGNPAEAAYRAANHSIGACSKAGYPLEKLVVAIQYDLILLGELAISEEWTDDSPVDVGLLGPLWPYGTPEGWPDGSGENNPEHLKIELITPCGLSEEESENLNHRVAEFFAELSALHIAMGGTGLRLVEHNSQETVQVEDAHPWWSGTDSSGVVV